MLVPISRKRLRPKKPPRPARVDTEGSSIGGGKFTGAGGGTGVPQSSQKRTLESKVLPHCEHSNASRWPQLRQKLADGACSYPQLLQAIALGGLMKSPGFLGQVLGSSLGQASESRAVEPLCFFPLLSVAGRVLRPAYTGSRKYSPDTTGKRAR